MRPKVNINIKALLEEVNLLKIQRCVSVLLVITTHDSLKLEKKNYYTSEEVI